MAAAREQPQADEPMECVPLLAYPPDMYTTYIKVLKAYVIIVNVYKHIPQLGGQVS